jgi:large subunit ribosomal protein L7/L12
MAEQEVAQSTAEAEKTYSPEVVDILDKIEKFSVLQLKELKEAYEERFGVTAAVAMGPVMAAPSTGEAEGEKEEKTTFDVVIDAIGEKKIQVIKAVRQVVSLGLKEAKEFVDSIEAGPKPVKEGVPKEEADKIKGILEESGATVSLK